MAQASGPSTKDFVEIADIRGNIVILKNSSLKSIIEVSSINFDLKSPDEQQALVSGFQNFLNFVDFPLQIIISSRKLNIEPYLKSLDDIEKTITNELLKVQIYEYKRFIKGLTDLTNIMSKHFYIVVPYYPLETATKQGIMSTFKTLFGIKPKSQSIADQQLETYRIQLDQRISVVMGAVSSLGLQPRILEDQELKDLYFSYYNPGHNAPEVQAAQNTESSSKNQDQTPPQPAPTISQAPETKPTPSSPIAPV